MRRFSRLYLLWLVFVALGLSVVVLTFIF